MRKLLVGIAAGLLAIMVCSCREDRSGKGGSSGKASPPAGSMTGAPRDHGGPPRVGDRPAFDRPTGTPIDASRASKQAGTYFGHLAKKEYAQAVGLFSAKMKQGLPEAKVKELWEQLLGQLGEYRSIAVLKSDTRRIWRRQTIRGEFANGTVVFTVTWNPEGELDGFFMRPEGPKQPPWEPPSYVPAGRVREISVTVGEGPLALPGVITAPTARGGKRLPAVFLVHGSGPQDRDETLGPNKPFKDLAWGLAAQDIIVLRYDKVTRAHPQESVKLLSKGFTMDSESTNDALRAAELLRKHELVLPERVFFLGHSQGAMAGPRAGVRDPKLAGLILLAGPTRSLAEVGLAQLEYIVSLGGPKAAAMARLLGAYKVQMKTLADPKLSPDTPAKQLPFGIPASFWLDLRGYHPEQVAKGLAMPVLVLQGEADYQVTMQDFAGWKQALAAKKNARCVSYPKLGHHFIDLGKPKAVPDDYATVKGHVTKAVIDEIARFIKTAK